MSVQLFLISLHVEIEVPAASALHRADNAVYKNLHIIPSRECLLDRSVVLVWVVFFSEYPPQ